VNEAHTNSIRPLRFDRMQQGGAIVNRLGCAWRAQADAGEYRRYEQRRHPDSDRAARAGE
jgi:hypothetical protein